MNKLLIDLSNLVGGQVKGNSDVQITGVADVDDAEEGDIVFAETPKHLETALKSPASAIITSGDYHNGRKPLVIVDNPRLAFARILEVFSPAKDWELGIHPSAIIGSNTRIGKDPAISANVYIGKNTIIGDNVRLYPFVYIGDSVRIGDNCCVYPFVSIYDDLTLGSNVTIHSGTVIGADGFGYTRSGETHYKIPQIGTVVIGDNVEIGANATVDRARTGKTVIGSGTKIDNLVQIAHNVTIGENCIIVAQVGISGSVEVGDRVVMAGQVGVKDHVTIGDDAAICARTGILGDVKPGEFLSGYPARPHKDQMRIYASQQRLPALLRQVKDLEKRLKELEDKLD